LGIGLLLTTLATIHTSDTAHTKAQLRFENAVQKTEDDIESRINTYIALLQAGSGLFAASDRISQSEFEAFVARLRLPQNYPGVQGIGFAKRFSAADLPALSDQVQALGVENFQLRPTVPRSEAFPIIYLSPSDRRNQVAIGFDMFSEPVRREAMEQARDQGTPAASGQVTLVQEIDPDKQAGFLIYLPVYRSGGIPPTVAERRTDLEGFIYSPFRADDLLQDLQERDAAALIDFYVYDGEQITPQALLHDPQQPSSKTSKFSTTRQLSIAGRTWTVLFVSRPELFQGSSQNSVVIVAIAGTVISLLLFALTRSQALSNQKAQRSALELQKSEAQLRLALETAQLGIWSWDLTTDRVTWSTDVEQLFGLQPKVFEETYAAFIDLVHPSDRDRMLQTVNTAIATRQDHSQEFRVIWPDGSLHWLVTTSHLLLDSADRPVRMIGMTMDITPRKQAEIALQQHNEREQLLGMISQRIRQSLLLEEILQTTVAEVRQFLEVDRVLICRLDEIGNGTVMTESVIADELSILGNYCTNAQRHSDFWSYSRQGQAIAVENRNTAKLNPSYLQLMQQVGAQASLTIPLLQGDQLWGMLVAHHCVAPRSWQTYEIELLQRLATQLAIAIQQSELYHQVQQLNSGLEQQVQERTTQLLQAFDLEARLKRITDKVRDSLDEKHILETAVQELALGLNVLCCNAALYNLDASIAQISYEYTALPSNKGRVIKMREFPEIYSQLLQGQYFQFCLLPSKSTNSPKSVLACPVCDDQGVIGDLWLFDHTEHGFDELEVRLVQQVANQCAIALRQARLYEASQTQVKALERLNWLKDDFLSTVSHELRTPVSNIKMAIQMLELALNQAQSLNGDNPKIDRYLQILQSECQREISLINDLLDLQRLEAGGQTQRLEIIYLQDWLTQVVEPFKDRARSHQQQLQIITPPEQMPPLVTDITGLERIISELINNACKYTPAGEVITVRAATTPGWVELQVSNSGIEIPASELPRIFEKFYRIPNGNPWKQSGTGLGLALVQRLTEHLGGQLSVQSTDGVTTFTVRIPNRLSQFANPKQSVKQSVH
jgi:PAS domain S-box-containing protein